MICPCCSHKVHSVRRMSLSLSFSKAHVCCLQCRQQTGQQLPFSCLSNMTDFHARVTKVHVAVRARAAECLSCLGRFRYEPFTMRLSILSLHCKSDAFLKASPLNRRLPSPRQLCRVMATVNGHDSVGEAKPLNDLFTGLPTTIFTVMTNLALKHKTINLGQGFPDTISILPCLAFLSSDKPWRGIAKHTAVSMCNGTQKL